MLIGAGRLGDVELTVPTAEGDRSYRLGDQVLITVNDRARGVVNGARGTVSSLDPSTGRIQIRLTDDQTVSLDRDWLASGALVHGYATTVHKAQGLTVDTTLVYGLGPLTREHGYVALSRGRKANHLYLTTGDEHIADCGPPRTWPDQDPRSLTAELVERLRDSRRHQLASSQDPDDQWRRDEELRRQRSDQTNDRGYGRAR